MFCNNCGKEMEDDQKFCTNCGVSVASMESMDSMKGSADTYTAQTDDTEEYSSPQTAYQQQYDFSNVSSTAAVSRKTITQALAAVFTLLTVITMLSNWLSFRIPMQDFGNSSMGMDDMKISTSSSQVANTMGQISDLSKSIMKELKNYDSSNEELKEVRSIVRSIGTASMVMNLVKIFVVVSILSFLIFIYMMIVGNKNGALIGQIGSTLAFFAAMIFAIAIFIFKFSLKDLFENLGLPNLDGSASMISSSVWVYLTMMTAALNLVFITVRKKLLRGE